MKASTDCTRPLYVCGNEKIKLIGGIDGYFPDFGHHLENEMGGLWVYPVKLLDGFWMHFKDRSAGTVDCYMKADGFDNYPHKNEFFYGGGLGHTTVSAVRTQLAPEGVKGILVKYKFINHGREAADCSTEFIARVDLRPVWLSEELGIFDGGKDEIWYREEDKCFLAKDCDNPWYTVIGCSPACKMHRSGDFWGPENTVGNGVSCAMSHDFELEPGEEQEITFYIAGSELSEVDAVNNYRLLHQDKDFEKEKEERYEKISEQSRLIVEDKKFQNIYDWAKVNADQLILDQETYGRGIMAGIPEYPWWFGCDSFYTLQGILGMGNLQLCRDTLSLIRDYSVKINGNGRIVHEILPNGYCPNPGNTQETAHFVAMVWKYFEWTGDRKMLEECLPYIRKSIAWLQEQDNDGDLYPSGYGIIEIAGLNMEMMDTIVYTCEAYDCYSKMLELTGETQEAEKFRALHTTMKQKINEELWDEEAGLYCDAYASYNTIREKQDVIEDQLKYSHSDETRDHILKLLEERKGDGCRERGWLLNRNWVINTPMETGIADEDKAIRALKKMEGPDYIGEYGMYLDALKKNATMTISTGVMAVAQCMYGRSDEALRLIEKMFSSFSMATPGSISEMSPDYGCFVQAWTAYSIFLPVAGFFFGIQPRASKGMIYVKPSLPTRWNRASLENVRVMDGTVTVAAERREGKIMVSVENHTSYPVSVQKPKNPGSEGTCEAVCSPGERCEVCLG